MDPARRKELEKIALEQLAATADNDEQWSYAWGDPGGKSFSFCSWAQYEEEKFDGTVEGLDLPWTEERQQLIETGQADPNEFELRQWRVAKCREAADDECRHPGQGERCSRGEENRPQAHGPFEEG